MRKCINCKDTIETDWEPKLIAKENLMIARKLACSERCFLLWWDGGDD